MNYTLQLHFETLEELTRFVDKKLIDKLKNPNDKRGGNLKWLHSFAQEYRLFNPTVAYSECLKKVAEIKKECPDLTIEEFHLMLENQTTVI